MTPAPTHTTIAGENVRSGWIGIATLLRPQGRRGEVLSEPLSDLPEIFRAGRSVHLAPASAKAPADTAVVRILEEHWFPSGKNAGRVVLKLSGCDTISDAEALAGQQIMIPAEELPALDADTFLVGDLVGCAFYNGDSHVGTVTEVEFATGPDGRTRLEDAAPLLGIRLLSTPDDSDPVLVPFVRAWLDGVDIAARRIVMHLPAGLLDDLDMDADLVGDETE